MELFLLLVASGALLIGVWQAARWAFHIDRLDCRERLGRRKRRKISGAFEDIVKDLEGE